MLFIVKREEPRGADAEGAAGYGRVPGNGEPRGSDAEGAVGTRRLSGNEPKGRT